MSTHVRTTLVVIKINGHEDKRSSKFSNLNSAKSQKLNNKIDLNNAFHDFGLCYIVVYSKPFNCFYVSISEDRLSP